VLIFYPETIKMFREKTYASFVQPVRDMPIPSEANQSKCVCCDKTANVSIHRSCLWCEGHACSCRQFLMCEKCSVKWYWRSSEGFSKSFATCPLCRAEYCLEDIVIYNFTSATEPELTLDQQIEMQKRKLAELESRLTPQEAVNPESQSAKRVKLDDLTID
jgi:hypothetical protein